MTLETDAQGFSYLHIPELDEEAVKNLKKWWDEHALPGTKLATTEEVRRMMLSEYHARVKVTNNFDIKEKATMSFSLEKHDEIAALTHEAQGKIAKIAREALPQMEETVEKARLLMEEAENVSVRAKQEYFEVIEWHKKLLALAKAGGE